MEEGEDTIDGLAGLFDVRPLDGISAVRENDKATDQTDELLAFEGGEHADCICGGEVVLQALSELSPDRLGALFEFQPHFFTRGYSA